MIFEITQPSIIIHQPTFDRKAMSAENHPINESDKIRSSDRSSNRPTTFVKYVSKFEYKTFRQRWEAELAAPFPLLKWGEAEVFLHENKEALLWILADWDATVRVNLAVLSAMGSACFAGLPFAALDLDEAVNPLHPLAEQLALKSTNCFIRFSSGKEVWRETGWKFGREFLKWFAALRETEGIA